MSRHQLFNPEGLPPATGFSYGSVAAEGRLVHLAGITGHDEKGTIADDLVDQFAAACRSVARVVAAAGGSPDDVVAMTIFTTDIEAYRSHLGAIGEAYRSVFARHYPPMALFGIAELFDPKAKVELVAVAVIPG